MRRYGITLIGILGTLVFCLDAGAVAPGPSSNRFEAIPERNVFGLKSPAPTETVAQQDPVPKILLTGITTLLGNKLALMKALLPARPGQPAKEQPLMLTEGQREGSIEVLAIDEHARSVKVNNHGTVMTLTFEKDGLKPPASTAAGVGPGYSALAGAGAIIPGVTNAGGIRSRTRVLPTRMPRPATTPETSAAQGANSPATGAEAVPSPTGAASGYAPAEAAAEPQKQLTPEEQILLQELQRQADKGAASTPSYPPSSTVPAAPSGPYSYPAPPGYPAPGMLPPGANMQRANPPLMPQ